MMKTHENQRIQFLDGLRGIAILLVVIYHTYSNAWKDMLPFYAPTFEFPPVKFGDLGVPLFFIISGFVIVMTLEKCRSLSEFMFKRWLRLFPAMLIATILILVTAPVFTARPLGDVKLLDSLPGLTFISHFFYKTVIGPEVSVLENGFWSLFVEVKFYLLAGWLYFLIGQKRMIMALSAMFMSYVMFGFIKPQLTPELAGMIAATLDCLDYEYYGWFAAGALFYRFYNSKDLFTFIAAVFLALLSARTWGGLMSQTMLAFMVLIAIFSGAMLSENIQKLLSNKVLTFFGFISYPLYLIHECATISTIVQLHEQFSQVNVYVLSIVPLAACIFISWWMAADAEPMLRNVLKKMFSHKFTKTRNNGFVNTQIG
jgi:peptidoglycan/LPS O-acetylase OafA/YrhL